MGMNGKWKITRIGKVIREPGELPVAQGWAMNGSKPGEAMPRMLDIGPHGGVPMRPYSTIGGYTVEELEKIADEHASTTRAS